MAQSGYTAISLYKSSTAGVTPSAGNLIIGELFINAADGKLYYKDPSNVVHLLASTAATGGGYTNLTVTGVLTVNDNTAAIPTAPTGSVLTVANVNGTNARVLIDGFGTSANGGILFRKANGTAASPSAVLTNDVFGVVAGFGYGATAYGSATRVSAQMVASEDWTDSAQGAYLSITTTQTGTTTTSEALRIGPFGEVGVYTVGGVNYGSAGQALLSGGAGAPPVWSTLSGTGTVTSVSLSTGSTGLTVSGGTTQTITGAGTFAISGILALASGGTGSSTAAGARTNLGLGALATANSVALGSQVTGTLPVANGGTGQTSYTNGQLLIGNTTGNTLTPATLTAGTGISITNGSGSITIATTGGGTGTVTSVAFSGGTTGLTVTGSPITTSGTITLAGTLATANGGTGLTGFTANKAVYATSTSALTTGTLPTAAGGTGLASFTSGGAVYASSTSILTTGTLPLTAGGTGATTASGARTSLGLGSLATLSSVSLTSNVTGTLPIANGGTGVTTGSFAKSLTTSGYQQLPGGLIMQWGELLVTQDGDSTVTWPIAFTTACLQAVCCHGYSFATTQDAGAAIFNLTTTNATIRNGSNSGGPSTMRWMAFGY